MGQKNIVYGTESWRQQLDIYLPDTSEEKSPVVIFVSGGAWIIGYKMWGWIMGQLFQRQGVLFIAPDYRNFPEATVPTMVEDINVAVHWILNNLEALGGDPDNVTLMSQSAGAHLSIMAVIEQAVQEAAAPASSDASDAVALPGWSLESLTRWVGISGPYDIVQVMPTMRDRGLPRRVIRMLMDHDLVKCSPTLRVRDLVVANSKRVLELLPPAYFFHGTADNTVHWQQSKEFAEVLCQGGVTATTKYYDGKSHTDPILEDPCDGDGDELMTDLLKLVKPESQGHDLFVFGSTQPKLLLKWAKICNPF